MNRFSPISFSSTARQESKAQSIVSNLSHAIQTSLGLELRAVQLDAAKKLLDRSLVQMQTGEGKTLTIAVAANLLAMRHSHVMVATANDYLAERDARWMQELFAANQYSVAFADPAATEQQRREAYRADVVYGTIRQFAFDYLRDLSAARVSPDHQPMIDGLPALIIDEADSVLLDEARTPLVIHQVNERVDATVEACFRWSAEAAKQFRQTADFVLTQSGAVALTANGQQRLLQLKMPASMNSLTMTEIEHALERAILINQTMFCDHHYLVQDDRIAIVDEYTGRASNDRTFGSGIHQAIEAREGLSLTPPSHPVARITAQEFASKFDHLCGLTATAMEDRDELQRVYQFRVSKIPTYAPCRRQLLDPVVCASGDLKRQRIVDEVRFVLTQQRAVLLGTRTVEQSETLSAALDDAGIEHVVLNARNHREEADIVALAGCSGRVTVATNMAGRGTDIPLDPTVRDAGGLHVIVAEMNTAGRIDQQLIGRCGRQGDLGSARIYVCPDDEIIRRAFDEETVQMLQQLAHDRKHRKIIRYASLAQARIQNEHRLQRRRLTAHETNLMASLRQLGLDPYLDAPHEPLG